MNLAVLLAAEFFAADPCALPGLSPGPPPWKPGEVLTLEVNVLNLIKAGTMTLVVEDPMFHGKLIPIRARVNPMPVLARIRAANGLAITWVE